MKPQIHTDEARMRSCRQIPGNHKPVILSEAKNLCRWVVKRNSERRRPFAALMVTDEAGGMD